MRRGYVHLLLSAYLALGATAWAEGRSTASEDFASGLSAFTAQDYRAAVNHFEAALAAGLEGPAVHYNIAVSYYKLGDYRHARNEFAVVARRYPAMRGLAEYNLGLVALRLGDETAADRYFRQARDDSRDEKIRRLAERQLRARPAAARAQWYGLFNTRVGHDNNVRLLSNDVPLPAGMSAASNSTDLTAVVSGPLSSGPGLRFDGSLYSVRYPDASFFDQDFLRLGFVYQWRWGQWLAEAGPALSRSTLDGDTYEKRAGAGLRVRREIGRQTSFGARYMHDSVTAGVARFAFVEGSRDWVELRLDHRNTRARLGVRYSHEANDRGINIASARNEVSVQYRYALDQRWAVNMEGSLRRSTYTDAVPPRGERLSTLSLGAARALPSKWEVAATVEFASNDSVDPYSYGRRRFSIGLSKSFY